MFNFTSFFLFIIWIWLGSIWSILMRIWAKELPTFTLTFDYFYWMFTNPWIITSYFLYFVPAIIWTYLLSKYTISFVQPILALTYVITPILWIFLLKEWVPTLRWIGIVVIIIWVFIVSNS